MALTDRARLVADLADELAADDDLGSAELRAALLRRVVTLLNQLTELIAIIVAKDAAVAGGMSLGSSGGRAGRPNVVMPSHHRSLGNGLGMRSATQIASPSVSPTVRP